MRPGPSLFAVSSGSLSTIKKGRSPSLDVETVVLGTLCLIKHKDRIIIEKGVTLFGIMDEYGYLSENDVFITSENLPGTKYPDVYNRPVLLTRSL